jgi:REP element-mobilizing transposase RayT
MNEKELELMNAWHSHMALLGHDMRGILESWDYGDEDDDGFMNTLIQLEELEKRMNKADPIMRAVKITQEMNINSDTLQDYLSHLDEEDDKARQLARQTEFENSTIIKTLRKQEFAIVNGRRYPDHTHFAFTDRNGLKISGRTFRTSWRGQRIWLMWTDKNGKNQKKRIETDIYSKTFAFPANSPSLWTEDGHYSRANTETQKAHLIAYRVITKGFERGFVYPKA